jgi:arsenate reductase
MTVTARPALHIDQLQALRTSAVTLAHEFGGTYEPGTVEHFLICCYDEIAERAVVINYLPLLAERCARQHLRELATLDREVQAGATPATLDAPLG